MAKSLLAVKQVENAKHTGVGDFTTLNDGGGLELRVRASGLKSWILRYQFQGKRKTPCIGEWPSMSLADARAKAVEMWAMLKLNICPIEHAKAEAEAEQSRIKAEAEKQAHQAEQARIEHERIKLFAQTAEEWIELDLFKRKDKGAEIRRMFAKDVLPYVGHKAMQDVTKADVMDIIDRVKRRGSLVQANHIFSSMRQFFNWCLRRDIIEKSPLFGLSKDKDAGGIQPERERVLSIDEIKQLRDQLPAAKMERTSELAIWIQLSTIVRIGELLQARWEHIDFNAGTWTIPAGNSKNAKTHTVFLSEFAARHFVELRSLTGWSEWLYPATRKDGHVCPKSITRQVDDRQRDNALTKRSQATGTLLLPGGKWTPHDLRRTGATMMGDLGTLSEVIEKCLNHTEANKMKRIYQRHELQAERREAWRRLGERLDEVINDKSRKVIPLRGKAA